MNNIFKYTFAAFSFVAAFTSCSDFGDTNIDPEHMNEGNVPYEAIFSNAQHQALGSDWDVWRNGLIYCGQWMNHVASINQWWEFSVYKWSDGYSAAYWETYHSDRGSVRDITTVLDKWKDDPKHVVDYNFARIMRVYIMHRMTDLYGDIPYSEAGRPVKFSYPKYDKQKDIYMDMLKELDEAQANLGSANAEMGKQDLFFGGNAASWKKFANSLMLRIAMRLVKVDETTAKTYVEKAVKGGLIASNSENVLLKHPGGVVGNDSSEPYAKIFVNGESIVNFFLHANFVNELKESNDPRLPLIAAVYDKTPEKAITDGEYQKDGIYDAGKQQGLPGGVSNNNESNWFIGNNAAEYPKFNIKNYPTTEEGKKEFEEYIGKGYRKEYSLPNRYTYSDPTSPSFVVTYAQTEFLLAEAVVRNYIQGDAAQHFNKGLRAALEQFGQFPNAKSLYDHYMSKENIDRYLAENSLDKSSVEASLKQINTQYWINCFCDEYETFANWRRSGYPKFKSNYDKANPVPLCDTDGEIARRFRYPTDESQINSENYKEAVSGLSKGDKFSSRVWWDAE